MVTGTHGITDTTTIAIIAIVAISVITIVAEVQAGKQRATAAMHKTFRAAPKDRAQHYYCYFMLYMMFVYVFGLLF